MSVKTELLQGTKFVPERRLKEQKQRKEIRLILAVFSTHKSQTNMKVIVRNLCVAIEHILQTH